MANVPEDGLAETAYPELAGKRDEACVCFACPTCGTANSTNTFGGDTVVCGNCWEKFTWPLA